MALGKYAEDNLEFFSEKLYLNGDDDLINYFSYTPLTLLQNEVKNKEKSFNK